MAFKKVISLLMIFIIAFSCIAIIPSAAAATDAEKQAAVEKRNQLQRQLAEINRKLAGIKDDVEKAKSKAETYSDRKNIVMQQISAIQETITLTTEELKIKQEELDAKEATQQDTYDLFKKRIRAMYMTKDTSTLSTILGATSFSELVIRAEVMRQVSAHDTDLINQLIKDQDEIKKAKAIIEDSLASLDEDKAALDDKYSELATLYQEANNQLSSAEALKEVTEEEGKKIAADFEAADAEFNSLMGSGITDDLGTGQWAWPVPGFREISSGFGWRTLYGRPNMHGGIDIAGGGIYGAAVIASDSGEVIRALYYTTGYGYHVMIDHGANNWTVYGHLSSIAVSYGQRVVKGQTVGKVGSTGNSTGPHLHFEIRINGTRVNPVNYL